MDLQTELGHLGTTQSQMLQSLWNLKTVPQLVDLHVQHCYTPMVLGRSISHYLSAAQTMLSILQIFI